MTLAAFIAFILVCGGFTGLFGWAVVAFVSRRRPCPECGARKLHYYGCATGGTS